MNELIHTQEMQVQHEEKERQKRNTEFSKQIEKTTLLNHNQEIARIEDKTLRYQKRQEELMRRQVAEQK